VRVTEFAMTRYGPLRETGVVSLGDFTLLFGHNEDGKTLTIDALVKLLLGQKARSRDFERLDRVDEAPEGYVIIRDDEGGELKLPEKGSLCDLTDLSGAELRNIFVIRDSDLSIAGESEFYVTVTDKLTGLRTDDLNRIRGALLKLGEVTETGLLSNTSEHHKMRDRMGHAKKALADVHQIAARAEEEGYEDLEEKAVAQRRLIARIEHELESLADARRRETYEKGRAALSTLKDAREKLRRLEIFNQEDGEQWRRLQDEIVRCREDEGRRSSELDELKDLLERQRQELQEAEREFSKLSERKKVLDERLRGQLSDYREKAERVAGRVPLSRSVRRFGLVCAALLALSMIGLILSHSSLFYLTGIVFLPCSLAAGWYGLRLAKDRSGLQSAFEALRNGMSAIAVEGGELGALLGAVRNFDEEYSGADDRRNNASVKAQGTQDKVEELRDEIIPRLRQERKGARDKLDELMRKSKEDSLEGYLQKLREKESLEGQVQTQQSVLDNIFGTEGADLQERITFWNARVSELEQFQDAARQTEYSETAVRERESKEEKLKKALEEIEQRMSDFSREFKEIERRASEVLGPYLEGENLLCESTVDLEAIRRRLESFVARTEEKAQDALQVIELMDSIGEEEKEKVSMLFGADSPVSEHFSTITGGRYGEVLFDQGTGAVQVKRRDGEALAARKLSGGAWDQLYFSIRLALGEKLLQGGKGFFIMDDPFVKADPVRLREQLDVLMRICEQGWQVVYFTAKGEVKDALAGPIADGAVVYREVGGLRV